MGHLTVAGRKASPAAAGEEGRDWDWKLWACWRQAAVSVQRLPPAATLHEVRPGWCAGSVWVSKMTVALAQKPFMRLKRGGFGLPRVAVGAGKPLRLHFGPPTTGRVAARRLWFPSLHPGHPTHVATPLLSISAGCQPCSGACLLPSGNRCRSRRASQRAARSRRSVSPRVGGPVGFGCLETP